MNTLLAAIPVAALLSAPAAAAVLRSATTLNSAVVRLSDLFDDAGPRAARVLGPGPAPGARIVVEARQLAAIARQFGVDWRPASPADRAVLDRPGRALPREQVFDVLRTALAAVGAPADGELELPGFTAPMVPVGGRTDLAVEQAEYDGASGRFTAMLAIAATDLPLERLPVSGRVQEMVELPVPTHRLPAGTVLRPGDLQTLRLHADVLRGETVRSAAEAVGMALKRPVAAGQPLATSDLGRPLLVQKGDRVAMELLVPGLAVTGQGLALEQGSAGERIQVQNPASRAVMEAEITGPDRVRVAPGSAPLQPTRLAQAAPR